MNDELDIELTTRYPVVYPPISNSGLHGFECGSGWFHFLDATGCLIQRRMDAAKSEPFVAHQIKEKFGELRVYYSHGDAYVSAVIDVIEGLSGRFCEICGDRGEIHEDQGWLSTRCARHLGTSAGKTVQREGQEAPQTGASPLHSPSIADVIDSALSLFGGNPTHVIGWYTRQAHALGGIAPVDLLNHPAGRAQLLRLIGQIEHGVYT